MASDMIFISYSRQDKAFVDKLTNDLRQAGFNLWRDTENLVVGTASWERAIREAIKQASAIILVASPDALQSNYVQGELTVAKLQNRPIYPIWATGENWIDCVPLDMANYQYVDGRDTNFEQAVNDLGLQLSSLLDTSQGVITLGLPIHEAIEISLAPYDTLQSLLNNVYMRYLYKWYAIGSYGKDWVLGNVKSKELVLPWEWFEAKETEALYDYDSQWAQKPLAEFKIHPGKIFGVWNFSNISGLGIALQSQDLMQYLNSENPILILSNLKIMERFELTSYAASIKKQYESKAIYGIGRYESSGLKRNLVAKPVKRILAEK